MGAAVRFLKPNEQVGEFFFEKSHGQSYLLRLARAAVPMKNLFGEGVGQDGVCLLVE